MNDLALFAGAGGGILAGHLLGWRTVCAVEIDAYARNVLLARQDDGTLEPFPVWDDVRTFDGRPWREIVDVVSGGFPCQDISAAGTRGGIDGTNSGLWFHMARIIGEVRPRYVYVENSAALTVRGIDRVAGDLAAMGYDARWGVISAADMGAPHERKRVWIVADANRNRQSQPGRYFAESGRWSIDGRKAAHPPMVQTWPVEPSMGRMAHGVAYRLDRLRALGNGQVPRVAAAAWQILTGLGNE